ncbi:MAG: sensor histidine kinase [Alphaproteobacteria bacterium]
MKSFLRRLWRLTPTRVVFLFVLLWLGVAVALAFLQVSKAWLLAYMVVTLFYAFFVAGWAMLRTLARMRGVADEGEALDGNQLLEALPVGAMIADYRRRTRAVNNRWLDIFRMPRGQVWKKKYNNFSDPILRRHIDRVMENRQPAYGLSLSTRLPDGDNLLFLADILPFGAGALVVVRPLSREAASAIPYLDVDRYHQLGKTFAHILEHMLSELADISAGLEASDVSLARERVRRLSGLIDRLAMLATAVEERPQEIDVAAWVRTVADLARPFAQQRQVSLEVELAEKLPPAEGRAALLEHALLVLVLNALEVSPPAGTVRLTARPVNEGLEVSVIDRGAGLREEIKDQLFTPFVSTKDEGLGLGLAIARQIAREHGGDLIYQPETPAGSRFALRLPKAFA